jgi:integrase
MLRRTSPGLALAEANAGGQQLVIANLYSKPLRDRGQPREPAREPRLQAIPRFCPATHRQLALFHLARDLKGGARRGFPPPADPAMAAFLDHTLSAHATRHGWSARTASRTRRAIAILLSTQDTPGAPLTASEIAALTQLELPVRATLEVIAEAGLLEDDRAPAIHPWFGAQITGLPDPMTAELGTWFHVMLHGSPTPPRRPPRAETTIRVQLRWAMPALRSWTAAGHQSLREISREDVLAALPPSGNPRSTLGQGLRSIFTILKGKKVIFTNPIARVPTGRHETRYPLPARVAVLREALDSSSPARAVLAGLLAFHGLRTGELRGLQLTDTHDGRLHLDNRTIPLAGPVRVRVAAYLDYRNAQWPNTANPHLLIHYRTANTTEPVGYRWIGLTLGMPARVIREDRILHEIHATGGDVRRVCDLFGMTVAGAMRYAATLEHPALATGGEQPADS